MTSSEAGTCVRLFELRRLEIGEIDGAEAESLRRHVAGCESCASRLAELEHARRTFLAEDDPAIASARILARLEAAESEPARGWLGARWPWALAAVLGALALAVVFVPPEDANRLKGSGVNLTLFVNRPEGPIAPGSGAPLTTGDQIQFRYMAAGNRYLYVVSVDGRRAITPLYPADGGPSVSIEPSGDRVLPGSIILDDAVGPERIFAFFSEKPLVFGDVEAAIASALRERGDDLRALDRVEWPREEVDVDQASVWFVKVR